MKKLILSLVAVVLFAVSSTAEAGMFGRLNQFRGCNPCEPAACQPCEQAKPACEACAPACDPCEAACGCQNARPFRGFLTNLRAKLASARCNPCGTSCDPCEPVCETACDPCEPVCDAGCCTPARPFRGFLTNLRARLAAAQCHSCDPCEPVCDPCAACK